MGASDDERQGLSHGSYTALISSLKLEPYLDRRTFDTTKLNQHYVGHDEVSLEGSGSGQCKAAT